MGYVVSARHKLIGQRVAIKFIRAEYVDSEDALARFKREARALVAVQSENVVRVFDYGALPDESPYLVMEYLTGRDLQQELRARGRIPLEEAAEIVLQACEGLASVHARGIVHRDIKPANLFLTRRTNGKLLVKIVDFGISKSLLGPEDESVITRSSIGSPHYMSPEQLRNARAVDARSDVWSLGVTLHRALTGALPFATDSGWRRWCRRCSRSRRASCARGGRTSRWRSRRSSLDASRRTRRIASPASRSWRTRWRRSPCRARANVDAFEARSPSSRRRRCRTRRCSTGRPRGRTSLSRRTSLGPRPS